MTQRTLRIDIEADDVFVNQIGTHVKQQWGQMSKDERAIISVLVKALNDARQAKTQELHSALPQSGIDAALDDIIESLRVKHGIPVIVSVGCGGGYRLPISRAECNLHLHAEMAVILRKIGRVVTMYSAMTGYGVEKPQGMDALLTLFKAHKLQAVDGQPLSTVKYARKRR